MRERIRAHWTDTEEYQLVITNMYLYVERVQLTDHIYKYNLNLKLIFTIFNYSFHRQFIERLKKELVLLPYRKYKLKSKNMPAQTLSFSWDTLFGSKEVLPAKIIVIHFK